ncbi:MAG: prepilin-type N-terminal cleavage/methylation domain-containing protein [Thermoguttaceae bacterium]|nr:prepilin-type N-terminal cleavage/methylation domain-containing protein [Thermoguttaceae bacterium]MDW8079396.1 prepilin-type N-terminal cleavage/methylation domain-containing protein [Thermoguttaceae bacterium]
MCAHDREKKGRQAFTLVEMLVVIVIIGILAGLLTGAVIMARTSARISMVRNEIAQLELALQMYKNQYGEYPPDFALINHSTVGPQARQRVLNHIRKRWPRFQPRDPKTGSPVAFNWDEVRAHILNGTGVDIETLTPAGALVFWLGGTPEDLSNWKPQGFHSDPTDPFKPGVPREKPLFEFRTERLTTNPLAYRPDVGNIPTGPFVYFRSFRVPQTGRYEYGYPDGQVIVPLAFPDQPDPEIGQAVPYLEPWSNMPDPTQAAEKQYVDLTLRRAWRNAESFQIIAPGLDGSFGVGLDVPSGPGNPSKFRISKLGARFSEEDYDNITNFCQRTLEDEIE